MFCIITWRTAALRLVGMTAFAWGSGGICTGSGGTACSGGVCPKPGGGAYPGGNSYSIGGGVGGLALSSSLRSRPNI